MGGETLYQIKLKDLATEEMKKIIAAQKAIEQGTGDVREEFKKLDQSTKYIKKIQSQIEETKEESISLQEVWKALDPTGFVTADLIASGIKNTLGAVVDFAKGSVQEFSDAQEGTVKLKALVLAAGDGFGYTADQLEYMASQMQSATLIEDDLVKSAQAVLVSFHNISGESFPRALQAAADTSKVFGSLESATESIGKALNTYDGYTKLAKSTGAEFTDAEVKKIKALETTNDLLGYQEIVLRKVEERFGGTAKLMASEEMAGIKKFNLTMKDLQETIGSIVGPSWAGLLGGIADIARGFLDADTSALGLDRQLQEMSRSAKEVLGVVTEQNKENAISKAQYDALVRIYPELSGKITEYATTLEQALAKEKELNDAHKEQIRNNLKASIASQESEISKEARRMATDLGYWNSMVKSMPIPDDLRPENLEAVRTAIAKIVQAQKDTKGKAVNPQRFEDLLAMDRQLQILIERNKVRADLNKQLETLNKTGTVEPPKPTGKKTGTTETDAEIEAKRKAYELQLGWDMELDGLEEEARVKALADAKAAYETQLGWDMELDALGEEARQKKLADEKAAYELQSGWDMDLDGLEEEGRQAALWAKEHPIEMALAGVLHIDRTKAEEQLKALEDFTGQALTKMAGLWKQYSANQTQAQTAAIDEQIKALQDATAEREREYSAELELRKAKGEDTTAFEISSLEEIKRAKVAATDQENALEEEKKKIKLENFNQQKALDIAQALASGAVATIETYKNLGGWPLGAIGAAVMGGITLAEVGVIASQVPALKDGGVVAAGSAYYELGDGNEREAVVPERLWDVFGLRAGGGGGDVFHIYINGIQFRNSEDLAREIYEKTAALKRTGALPK